MPINGAGLVSKVSADVAIPNDVVESAKWNDQNDDFVDSLNAMVQLSGVKPFTGDQPFGTHKATGVGDGTAAQDAATLKQVQTGVASHATAVAGTVDAIQLTFSPANTTLSTYERIRWKSAGANTSTTPTISKDAGSTNKTVKKGASAALAVGDLGASGFEHEAEYNGTDWILLNPAIGASAATTSAAGIVELATDGETQTGTDTARAITPSNLTAKEATTANWLANTADRILTTDIVYSSAALVSLTWTSGGNTAVDMSTFINATVTASSGNSTLGQPSNTKVGQTGFIRIIQDSTPRTLAYHADWKFAGGSDPVISTGSGAVDLLFYQVIATNFIYATLVKALA